MKETGGQEEKELFKQLDGFPAVDVRVVYGIGIHQLRFVASA